jgi:hypothetical protein
MMHASSLPFVALLAGVAIVSGPAFAQQSQQRSGTPAQKGTQAQNGQQRGGSPAAQQKSSATPAKPAAGSQAKPGAGGPGGTQTTPLGTFTDWEAHASGQGRSRMCWVISKPTDRLPKDLNRDPAYLFVSFRPADNVKNEVAFRMGFAMKDGSPAEASVGQARFDLLAKGTDAWIRNPAEESQAVGNMMKGQTLTVKVTSVRGNTMTDRYSLSGFAQAWDRAMKECR